jgi:hypothetical protein
MNPSAQNYDVTVAAGKRVSDHVRIIFDSLVSEKVDQLRFTDYGPIAPHQQVVVGDETLKGCAVCLDLRPVVLFGCLVEFRVERVILRGG